MRHCGEACPDHIRIRHHYSVVVKTIALAPPLSERESEQSLLHCVLLSSTLNYDAARYLGGALWRILPQPQI